MVSTYDMSSLGPHPEMLRWRSLSSGLVGVPDSTTGAPDLVPTWLFNFKDGEWTAKPANVSYGTVDWTSPDGKIVLSWLGMSGRHFGPTLTGAVYQIYKNGRVFSTLPVLPGGDPYPWNGTADIVGAAFKEADDETERQLIFAVYSTSVSSNKVTRFFRRPFLKKIDPEDWTYLGEINDYSYGIGLPNNVSKVAWFFNQSGTKAIRVVQSGSNNYTHKLVATISNESVSFDLTGVGRLTESTIRTAPFVDTSDTSYSHNKQYYYDGLFNRYWSAPLEFANYYQDVADRWNLPCATGVGYWFEQFNYPIQDWRLLNGPYILQVNNGPSYDGELLYKTYVFQWDFEVFIQGTRLGDIWVPCTKALSFFYEFWTWTESVEREVVDHLEQTATGTALLAADYRDDDEVLLEVKPNEDFSVTYDRDVSGTRIRSQQDIPVIADPQTTEERLENRFWFITHTSDPPDQDENSPYSELEQDWSGTISGTALEEYIYSWGEETLTARKITGTVSGTFFGVGSINPIIKNEFMMIDLRRDNTYILDHVEINTAVSEDREMQIKDATGETNLATETGTNSEIYSYPTVGGTTDPSFLPRPILSYNGNTIVDPGGKVFASFQLDSRYNDEFVHYLTLGDPVELTGLQGDEKQFYPVGVI